MGRRRTSSKARWSSVNFRQGRVANINLNRRKSADADLLRDMIGFAAERLMELEVGAKTGADYHGKTPERKAQRKGYRERD